MIESVKLMGGDGEEVIHICKMEDANNTLFSVS